MGTKEDVNNIIETLMGVKNVNDYILKESGRLKIILLNLKIEQAKLKESNGIKPITDELENIISNIEQQVILLNKADNTDLITSINNLMKL